MHSGIVFYVKDTLDFEPKTFLQRSTIILATLPFGITFTLRRVSVIHCNAAYFESSPGLIKSIHSAVVV